MYCLSINPLILSLTVSVSNEFSGTLYRHQNTYRSN